MSLKIVNPKTRILTVPSAIHLLHMKAFDYWKSTYLMVIDIVSLLGVLLCPTHLVWILEKNIKNWLDENQKANRPITLVSSLFISWQEITDFEKLNPFITDEYPYMIHQKFLKWCTLQYLLLLLWIFLSCSLQLASFIEKSNFSVYGVYIWKSLKNSFHMYQMQNLLGNDSYKKYAG